MELILVLIVWYLLIAVGCGVWFRFRLMQPGQNDFDIYRYGLSWPVRLVRRVTTR